VSKSELVGEWIGAAKQDPGVSSSAMTELMLLSNDTVQINNMSGSFLGLGFAWNSDGVLHSASGRWHVEDAHTAQHLILTLDTIDNRPANKLVSLTCVRRWRSTALTFQIRDRDSPAFYFDKK
jgi:hypothetical protein